MTHRMKDHVVPTLSEVHPDNGVIEPDDNYENMRNTFLPWLPPEKVSFHTLHNYMSHLRGYRPVILLKRVHLQNNSASLNHLLRSMCNRLCFKVQRMSPCALLGLDVQVRLPGEDVVEICLTALIAYDPNENKLLRSMNETSELSSDYSHLAEILNRTPVVASVSSEVQLEVSPLPNQLSIPRVETGKSRPFAPSFVFITPLARVTGYHVKMYCGLVVLHFIREGAQTLETASINSYNHKFILEVMAVAKAHVRCIGGNALLSFRILPQETAEEDVEKAYCMITIGGDAALLEED